MLEYMLYYMNICYECARERMSLKIQRNVNLNKLKDHDNFVLLYLNRMKHKLDFYRVLQKIGITEN